MLPTHVVGVKTVIRNSSNQVLVMFNPEKGWDVPGGAVEHDEDLISALEREVMEETGVFIQDIKLAGVYSNLQETNIHSLWFTSNYAGGELRTSDESVEVIWIEEINVVSLLTLPWTKERVRDVLTARDEITYRCFTGTLDSLDSYCVTKECRI